MNLMRKLTKLVAWSISSDVKFGIRPFDRLVNVRTMQLVFYSDKTIKTPTNSHKIFKPQTVSVTKSNKHLEIRLLDQDDKELGVMSMQDGKKKAKEAGLLLAIIDEKPSPPLFKLMKGKDLVNEIMKISRQNKLNKEHGNYVQKEKEINLNLGIEDNDFNVKIRMMQNFYDKGHSMLIKIFSKINSKSSKNIPQLQKEFVKRLQDSFPSVKLKEAKKNDNLIILRIESKNNHEGINDS